MCGICGFVNIDKTPPDPAILDRMNAALAHRGPDEAGTSVNGSVALAMRRLSIIDLTGGRQPISNEDGAITVVCNGEIYNSPQLRVELEARGHQFSTRTDTEAIVHQYEENGKACVDRLNGMFAFAVHDRVRRRLFLARDRIGIKPLYYYHDDRLLAFSSELTSLLQHPGIVREVDLEGLHYYLSIGSVVAPFTLFKGVRQLLPGETLVFEENTIRKNIYWAPPIRIGTIPLSEEEAATRVREILEQSVREHLLSDVPVGAFLSGGIDSSTVVAFMARTSGKPVTTFTIRFEEQEYDESPFAREVARHCGTDHREFTIRNGSFKENLLRAVLTHHGQPTADTSAIPTMIVSAIAARDRKVVLSGDGGDEVFAGYMHYAWLRDIERLAVLPPSLRSVASTVLSRLAGLPVLRRSDRVRQLWKAFRFSLLAPGDRYLGLMELYSPQEIAGLVRPECRSPSEANSEMITRLVREISCDDSVEKFQRISLRFTLPDDMLAKVDRMSMASGLEVRVPLLDHRLVEFGLSLPGRMQLDNGIGKRVLRRAVKDLLPEKIFRHRKWGFSLPLHRWVTGEYYEMAQDLLSEKSVKGRGILNPRAVRVLLDQARGRIPAHPSVVSAYRLSHRLFMLVMMELWFRNYIDRIIDKPVCHGLMDAVDVVPVTGPRPPRTVQVG